MELPPLNTNKLASNLKTTVLERSTIESLLKTLPTGKLLHAIAKKAFAISTSQNTLIEKLIAEKKVLVVNKDENAKNQTPKNDATKTIPTQKPIASIPTKSIAHIVEVNVLKQNILVLTRDIEAFSALKGLLINKDKTISLQFEKPSETPKIQSSSPQFKQTPQKEITNPLQLSNKNNTLIKDSLRLHIPREEGITKLAQILNEFSLRQPQKISTNNHNSTPLQTKLQSLINSLTLSLEAKPVSAEAIKSHLLNSGQFLESKLLKLATEPLPERKNNRSDNRQAAITQTKPSSVNTIHRIKTNRNLTNNFNPEDFFNRSNTQRPTLKNASDTLPIDINEDLKSNLLQINTEISKLLNTPLPTESKTNPLDALTKILTPVLFSKIASNSDKQNVQQVLHELKRIIQSSLSRVSSLQLKQLTTVLTEPSITTSGGHFEIPIRFGDSLFPLFLNISEFEEPVDTPKKEDQKKADKDVKRRWEVFMQLELKDYGFFATELRYIGSQLKTKFWIENTPLKCSAMNKIEEFKNDMSHSGVEVTECLFLNGAPPNKSQSLNQSLVDIRT